MASNLAYSISSTVRFFRSLPYEYRHIVLEQLTGPASSPILVIQLSFEDDAWLYVATTLPMAIDERNWLSADRLFVLFVALVTVLGVSFWVIRGVTRPLARLARAARQLGDDLEAVPLSERGPREVAASARAFNRMQERIRSQIKERERLFSAISHDLKTPITRLRLRAEMLDDAEQRERFCASLDELDTLVKGALASVRELDLDESWKIIDVRELLVSLAQDLKVQGGKVSVAGEAATLRVKPLSFKRCLANLLENAIFHGDRAAVTIRHGAESLDIVIRDHGPGIPDDQFQRVFAPFVRLEPSRSRNTGGSGLGLSIARHIAHAHGAALNLANHPSGGLVVTLHFPCRTVPCTSLR
ncbi:ATP-binding protein [Modicisalibacter xianhensis]|uniref:histidine kinase n=1 Tax=Modicisalibacter xianhensis TaxID=442341 RepID=A0A1I3CAR6_9GAMM|nr:Signal transduction histidine kinase [Halomonas xianhensis]